MQTLWIVLIIVLVLFIICKSGIVERFEDATQKTILVSCAAYRDAECSSTLRDMFKKASHPERVFAAVCEQNKEGALDESCITDTLPPQFKNNVRIVRMSHTEALGPTYARYICSTLYKNEDYFAQIDSHTTFVQGWDDILTEMIKKCPSSKPVITHYSPDSQTTEPDEYTVPVLCDVHFDGNGIPNLRAILKKTKPGELKPTPFVSGNFFFAPASILKEVPFDPDLPHLFQGEEILYSARAWTRGWDFFTPAQNVVKHHYERKGKPKFWDDIKDHKKIRDRTLLKVKRILEMSAQESPIPYAAEYGVGNVRSMKDYWKFAAVDPLKKTSNTTERFCPP